MRRQSAAVSGFCGLMGLYGTCIDLPNPSGAPGKLTRMLVNANKVPTGTTNISE